MSAFQAPPAPAEFIGWQVLGENRFELFNLTRAVEGHPVGSSVSRKTLEDLGYAVAPSPPEAKDIIEAEPALRPAVFPNPYLFAD